MQIRLQQQPSIEDSPKPRREREREHLMTASNKHQSSQALLRSVNSSSPVLKQQNLIATSYEVSSAVGALNRPHITQVDFKDD